GQTAGACRREVATRIRAPFPPRGPTRGAGDGLLRGVDPWRDRSANVPATRHRENTHSPCNAEAQTSLGPGQRGGVMSETRVHAELQELLPGAALEILDEGESEIVRDHVAGCPECDQLLNGYREAAAAI